MRSSPSVDWLVILFRFQSPTVFSSDIRIRSLLPPRPKLRPLFVFRSTWKVIDSVNATTLAKSVLLFWATGKATALIRTGVVVNPFQGVKLSLFRFITCGHDSHAVVLQRSALCFPLRIREIHVRSSLLLLVGIQSSVRKKHRNTACSPIWSNPCRRGSRHLISHMCGRYGVLVDCTENMDRPISLQ